MSISALLTEARVWLNEVGVTDSAEQFTDRQVRRMVESERSGGWAGFRRDHRALWMDIGPRVTVSESAGGQFMYERVTVRVINGRPFRFAYRIDVGQFAHLVVGDEEAGVQIHKYELGYVATEDLPGMTHFSFKLGELFKF